MLDGLGRDSRFALRQMARAPMLSAVAVLVLALGIGTNAAVFAVIDGVLFRPPPGVSDADGLVTVHSVPIPTPASSRFYSDQLTYSEFLALREDPAALGDVAAWTRGSSMEGGVALRTDLGEELIAAELVTSAYFALLRTPMALGSAFQPADDRPGNQALHVVLGYGFWNQRMGGSADVIGRTLTLNGYPFTIIGVADRVFAGAGGEEDPFDVWLPAGAAGLLFPAQPELLQTSRRFDAIARLPADVPLTRARAAAEAAGQRIMPAAGTDPEERRRLSIAPYRGLGAAEAMQILTFVGGAGGLIGGIILLIACVNVSALLLGRSLARRSEIAVRLALGAGRATIVRQLLTESVLLGIAAGTLGILLAAWALDALGARLFTFPVQLSPRIGTLVATVAVAAGTGILFGTVPALHATRTAVFTALKDAVAGGDPRTSRLRGWFAVAQLALSLPLLAAAGLLVSGVIRSLNQDAIIPDAERLLAVSFDLRPAGYNALQIDALLTESRARVAALPGVQHAAFARWDPTAAPYSGRIELPPGAEPASGQPVQLVSMNSVDPEYFQTVGIAVTRGRAIDRTDSRGSVTAIVIGEDFARRLWPGEDPIGRTVTYIRGRDQRSVLTVIGTTRRTGPDWDGSAGTPVLYASRAQVPDTLSATLVVRTSGDAAAVIPSVRESIHALAPGLVTGRVAVIADRMRESRVELTHATAGAAGIGLLALLLACVGLYAVVAFGVAERTREIGVRVALGASRPQVVRLFVRGGLRLALTSLAAGIPLTFAAVKLLGAGMFGVEEFRPLHLAALGTITLLLIGVATISSWIPARRSATVNPVNALRTE